MNGVHDELRARNRAGARTAVRTVRVVRTRRVRPHRHRITLAGDDLAGFEDGMLPADAIKVALRPVDRPGPTGLDVDRRCFPDEVRPEFRVYTVRRFDPETTELDLDVVLHGAGPGTHWALNARPGEPLTFFGPRSDFYAAPYARAHLLVGDDTAIPAISAITESLPETAPVHVIAEVGDLADRVPFHCRAPLTEEWYERAGAAPGTTGRLLTAVTARDILPDTQVWVCAEAAAVRGIRRLLLGERRFPRADLHASGYWKRGMTTTDTDAARLEHARDQAVDDHHDIDIADLTHA